MEWWWIIMSFHNRWDAFPQLQGIRSVVAGEATVSEWHFVTHSMSYFITFVTGSDGPWRTIPASILVEKRIYIYIYITHIYKENCMSGIKRRRISPSLPVFSTAVNMWKYSPVSLSVSPTHASNPYCTVELVLLYGAIFKSMYLICWYTIQCKQTIISLFQCLSTTDYYYVSPSHLDHQLDRGVLQHSYLGLSTPTRPCFSCFSTENMLGLVRDFWMTSQNLRDLMSWFSITIGNSVLAQLLPTQWSSLMRLVSLRCNSLKSISTYDSPSALILCKLVDEAKTAQVIHTSE